MEYINPKTFLDGILLKVQDNSTQMRSRFLDYFNASCRELADEPRDWHFLRKTSTVTVTSGVITKPSDYDRFVSITNSSDFFLKRNDLLTSEEAFQMETTYGTGTGIPKGIVETLTTLKLWPIPTDTSASLTYVQAVPGTYLDVTTATVFPKRCVEWLRRRCLTHYYEYDQDERFVPSQVLLEKEIFALKYWDNRQEGLPKMSNRGYVRDVR
jgi:hypothetical protein